jgi:hypothetical protein
MTPRNPGLTLLLVADYPRDVLRRPERLSVITALLAYVQAAAMSLCFVICLDDDGCATLEAVAGHCCFGGVPVPPAVGDGGVLAGGGAHRDDHPCAGCVDVPLLGETSRLTPPATLPATPGEAPCGLAIREPEAAAMPAAPAPARLLAGLAQFDRVLLTC